MRKESRAMDSQGALEVMHKAPYITVSFIDEDGKPYGLPLSLASDDEENLNLFDFELDADDMLAIAKLDTAHSLFLDHHSGETTKQFMEWRAVVKPTE